MIAFDAKDPFPDLKSFSYYDAKEHARLVDDWLGFQFSEIETSITRQENQQTWIGLDIQSLQTPYIELRSLLSKMPIQDGDLVIDLGCAYGRLAHVMRKHYPLAKYIGYEIIQERVQEAQRIFKNSPAQQILQGDLSQMPPPPAEHYFLYDYGSNAAISKTLNDLLEISRGKKIVVAARGKASRTLIHQNHPWLCEVESPQHFDTFSIYFS